MTVITVHDENHTTCGIVHQLGESGSPFTEDYARAGVAAREDTTNRTDEYLREAIGFLETKPGVNRAEVVDLKKALARFLLHEDKYVEAIDVLDDVLALQRETLEPDDPELAKTIADILQAYRNNTYSVCANEESSKEHLEAALKMAEIAADLAPDDRRIWLQAFAYYGLGKMETAQKAMRESLATDSVVPTGAILLAAMIEHAAGDAEMAQACYAVAVEFSQKSSSGGAKTWLELAADTVGDPPALGKMDAKTRAGVYGAAIKGCPEWATAYRLRGRYFGGLGEWEKALADYHKAAELMPGLLRHREGEAAIALQCGTPEQQNEICKKMFEEWEEASSQTPRMDMVLMCSLCPGADIDRQRLTEIADEVLASTEPRAFLLVAKGMSLYRCKQYEKAAATISIEGSVNPKDTLLGLAFLAMSHKQLGDDAKARQTLKQAQTMAEATLAKPAGKPLPYQDHPVVWCMVQAALREAEGLINGS